jgi:ClpP class serine protease
MQTQLSPNNFPHIRSAIYSTPWAITSQWLDTICEIAEAHIGGRVPVSSIATKQKRKCPNCETGWMKLSVRREEGKEPKSECTCPNCGCECEEDDLPPYDIVSGVALLQLSGPLFPKANLFTMLSGATSYEQFGNDFSQALSDGDVNAVAIISDSPGGSCLRLSELCSRIFAARDQSKPIVGFIDPMCCSAAYAIVSQCERIYISESGMAGSIGTVMKYSNWDRAERNAGNDPVMLTSTDVKQFGTPQSLAQYQSLIDTLLAYFNQFKEIVSRGRKGIDIDAVSGANVWIGKEAVGKGLVDGVSTLEKIIADLTGK